MDEQEIVLGGFLNALDYDEVARILVIFIRCYGSVTVNTTVGSISL